MVLLTHILHSSIREKGEEVFPETSFYQSGTGVQEVFPLRLQSCLDYLRFTF